MNKTIVRSFEDLNVYQRAYVLALDVHKRTLVFPKHEQYALADQMRRASKSICANVAEGFAKQRASSPEFKRFVVMALGSSDEMRVWISFAVDLGYLESEVASKLKEEYVIVSRMLNGLKEKWT